MNDMTWKQQIDQYEREITAALAAIDAIVARIPAEPGPQTTTPPVYMSGRWKLRDGTMYGR
jgi:hypothetical protein